MDRKLLKIRKVKPEDAKNWFILVNKVWRDAYNHIFPKENINLYKQILDSDGLIISEYPPATKHQSKYFLQRNRIVSGLSLGVLVIEATSRSGTSVTARLANLQERKVFAIPHEIWNSHGIGTNRLIKNGAILVDCTEDILQEFKSLKKLSKKLKKKQKEMKGFEKHEQIFKSRK